MSRNNVILLNPPGDKLYIRDYYCSFTSKANYVWPPQDLIYLSGIIDQDFDVHVIDGIVDRKSSEEVISEILAVDPLAVIFTTGTATLAADFKLMEELRKKKDMKVIASAGIMKFMFREIFQKYNFCDAVLLDFAVEDILTYIKGNQKGPLKGMIYRQNGRFVESSGKLPRLYKVPVPRHDLFPFRKYKTPLSKRIPFAEVVTSLGCPYNCAFCTAGAFGYRTRDVDNVIEELLFLSNLGVKEILFQDPTFTINTRRVTEMCRKMINNNLDFTWSCNGDIKSLNEEKIKIMKQAGCHTMMVGIESGSDEILEKYSKPITVKKIKEAIGLMNKYKIKALGYFIIGLPGENRESILKTIELAKQLKLDIASFSVATPDIGTPLRKEALKEGWIDTDIDVFDSTEFPILETGSMTKEEIWALRNRAVREYYLRPSYLLRKIFGIRSLRDIKTAFSNASALLKNT